MIFSEFVYNWHNLSLISIVLAGLLYFILFNIKKGYYLLNSMMLILAALLLYIITNSIIEKFLFKQGQQILDAFPYLPWTLSFLVTIWCIYLTKSAFRLSEKLVKHVVLVLVFINSIGIAGQLIDTLMLIPNKTLFTSLGNFLTAEAYNPATVNIIFIISLILSYLALLHYSNKIKHVFSLASLAILIFLVLKFIFLFFVKFENLPILTDRILGLNTIQWAILLIGILWGLYLYTIEKKPGNPKAKMKSQYYSFKFLLIFYAGISIIAYNLSDIIQSTNQILFIAAFITTTILLIYRLIKSIQAPYLKPGVIVFLLFIGMLFIQDRFFSGDEIILPKERKTAKPIIFNSRVSTESISTEFQIGSEFSQDYTMLDNDSYTSNKISPPKY